MHSLPCAETEADPSSGISRSPAPTRPNVTATRRSRRPATRSAHKRGRRATASRPAPKRSAQSNRPLAPSAAPSTPIPARRAQWTASNASSSKPAASEALQHELAEPRDRAQTVELAQARAQAALEAEQRLRAQLQTDLQTTTKRLEAAEKARDAAITTLEAAATRGATPPNPGAKRTDN